MVQRKAPNKLSIKTKPIHHLKSDNTQLSSPQTHDLKKIMKKTRPIKRPDPNSPPFTTKKTPSPPHGAKQSPNYMKSTTSFDARKERSSPSVLSHASPIAKKTPSPKNYSSGSGCKALRGLMKSPSFKPLRATKKCSSSVMLCEDLDAQRATCSSTLKDSKFPSYLELSPRGTELDGTSEMKVCPYTYCSLNGHHHTPVPPLKSFLSVKRLAMKTQKSFKLGCLSPRQTKPKPVIENKKETKNGHVEEDVTRLIEEESRDFFIETYSKDGEDKGGRDSGHSEIDWEEGCCFDSCLDDVREEKILKTGVESLYGGLEELYDEESVSSGAWLEEDGDYESDGSYQQMKIDNPSKDQSFPNYDEDDMDDKIVSVCKNAIFEAKKDELRDLNLSIQDHDINCSIDYQESETVPDFEENSRVEGDKRQTIIYNIIQFNISIFINGVKTEDSKTDKGDKKASELVEEQIVSNKSDDENKLTSFNEVRDLNQMVAEKQEDPEKERKECDDKNSESLDEEPASRSDEEQTYSTEETFSSEELPEYSTVNLKRCKKLAGEMEDLHDFNPRGPNFLPEVADPDAETVDLKHQTIDERKNSEEWMVDFALQQAVTTLAPERKKKVALLVEAFEKVMPIPKYETRNRHAPKAFTNTRPMQACS